MTNDSSPAGSTPPAVSSQVSRKRWNPLVLTLGAAGLFLVLFLGVTASLVASRLGGGSATTTGGTKAKFFGGTGSGHVGILEIKGAILDSKRTLEKLEALVEDDSVKAIVVRLNSPGGAVGPSQEIYEAIKRVKKPVVSSMGSIAASGAYYIACGTPKVYANPGTITGSIGVIMEFANLEKLYEWAKIKRYSIKTGKFKDAGAEYREMGPEERELLQAMVDDVLEQFKKAVADGRRLTPSRVTELADGRIFSGAQAKAVRLVDELGTLQDAIEDAAKLAGLTGKPSVVYPAPPKRNLMDFILSDSRGEDAETSSIVERLIDQVASRFVPASSGRGMLEPGIYWLWHGAL